MRNNRLVSLWNRLLYLLGIKRPTYHSFGLDLDLLQTLQGLAEQEQRPTEEVAADLLCLALDQHQVTGELIRRWETLSPREQQVGALICTGYTNRQIAAHLRVSPETIKSHARNILKKFGLHSRAELRLLLANWDFRDWTGPAR